MRLPPGADGWPGFTSPSVPGIVSSCPRASLLSSVRMSRPLLPGRLLPCNAFPPPTAGPVAQALPLLLDRAGLASSFSLRSAHVLVKPNLLTATPLACTSPVVVAAVCRWLLDQGARVRVGDSPGFGTATAVARRQAWKRPCGRWACGWSPWPIPVRWSCPCAGAGPFPSGWPGGAGKRRHLFPAPGQGPFPDAPDPGGPRTCSAASAACARPSSIRGRDRIPTFSPTASPPSGPVCRRWPPWPTA